MVHMWAAQVCSIKKAVTGRYKKGWVLKFSSRDNTAYALLKALTYRVKAELGISGLAFQFKVGQSWTRFFPKRDTWNS